VHATVAPARPATHHTVAPKPVVVHHAAPRTQPTHKARPKPHAAARPKLLLPSVSQTPIAGLATAAPHRKTSWSSRFVLVAFVLLLLAAAGAATVRELRKPVAVAPRKPEPEPEPESEPLTVESNGAGSPIPAAPETVAPSR
jgi:hypothetical protein